MNRYTFLDRAREFAFSRKRVLESLDEEDIADIRIVTFKGTIPEYKEAIIVYLNALINHNPEVFKLIREKCGEEIFQGLLINGLRKIGG